MPLSKKRSVTYLLLIAAALLFAYSLRFVFHPMTDNSLLAISMMTLRWAIQVPKVRRFSVAGLCRRNDRLSDG